MPKKSKPAKRQPLYRRPAPKPGGALSVKRRASEAKQGIHAFSTLNAPRSTTDLPHAHPIAPAYFALCENGQIQSSAAVPAASSDSLNQSRRDACATLPRLAFSSDNPFIRLYHGNSLELLDAIAAKYPEGRFDAIFADPPYFLSNGGITCHAGKMVKVDKGDWDVSRGPELNHEFNVEWLRRCQRVLKPNGTIWVTGTHYVIFSIGYAMQQLGYKILNNIAWEKPNPPPNLSCRYFTHSKETVLWAAKNEKSKHVFNYKAMKAVTGKQMKTVWTIQAPRNGEKAFGKHPTQKPVALVERCLLASTNPGDLVLDPFLGGGTTTVACVRIKRGCVGIELDEVHAKLAQKRIGQSASNFRTCAITTCFCILTAIIGDSPEADCLDHIFKRWDFASLKERSSRCGTGCLPVFFTLGSSRLGGLHITGEARRPQRGFAVRAWQSISGPAAIRNTLAGLVRLLQTEKS